MNKHSRFFIALGALSAALSVALGAAGAHVFVGKPPHLLAWFQTALQYHQMHALGLMLLGLLAMRISSAWVSVAGGLMLAGTLLFSGNLYLRSLADFHDFHAVTPYGGGALILAWLVVGLGSLLRRDSFSG